MGAGAPYNHLRRGETPVNSLSPEALAASGVGGKGPLMASGVRPPKR